MSGRMQRATVSSACNGKSVLLMIFLRRLKGYLLCAKRLGYLRRYLTVSLVIVRVLVYDALFCATCAAPSSSIGCLASGAVLLAVAAVLEPWQYTVLSAVPVPASISKQR